MYKKERLEKEIDLIEKNEYVSIKDISAYFNINPITVRRDFDELSKKISIERTHGGVKKTTRRIIPGIIPPRISFSREEKTRIAKAAVKEICQKSKILIGGGSTNYLLAKELSETIKTGNLSIITTSGYSGFQLLKNPFIHVSIPSGYLKNDEAVVLAKPDENEKFDIVFLSVKGIHPEFGFTTEGLELIDRDFVGTQGKIIVLADHTKFGLVAVSKMFDFNDIDLVITNKELEQKLFEILSKKVKIKLV